MMLSPDAAAARDAHLHKLGWRPEKPDQRDTQFDHNKVLRKRRQKLPAHVDLRETGNLQPIYDQGNLGSCTANASGKAYEFQQRQQGLSDYVPSRLFIYLNERKLEGSIPYDAGAEIRDGLKVLNKLGAPHETLWPYNESQFTVEPPPPVYDDGLLHRALGYQAVEVHTTAVKAALAAGHPVIAGFTVYESFWEIGADGFMKVPGPTEKVEGGHAIIKVGYQKMKAPWDRAKKDYEIIQNSWGSSWGDGGYFYAPMGWFCNRYNADDFWLISQTQA